MIRLILTLFFALSCFTSLFAQESFEKGLNFAQAKKYTLAIREFKSVLETNPANESAVYNLGNCYLHNKENGKAILYLEKYLKLNPSDEEAMTKIDQAYLQLGLNKTWNSAYSTSEILIFQMGPNTWVILSIVFSILMSWMIFLSFKQARKNTLALILLLFVLTIFCLYGAFTSNNYIEDERFAIVTEKSIPIFANDLGELTQNSLNEGTRVEFISKTKTNIKVRLEGGKTALIKSASVEFI